jgi:hypothetical protein
VCKVPATKTPNILRSAKTGHDKIVDEEIRTGFILKKGCNTLDVLADVALFKQESSHCWNSYLNYFVVIDET